MPILQIFLVGAAGFWGQTQPASLPESTQEGVPYTRLVDTVIPAGSVTGSQDIPILEEIDNAWEVHRNQHWAEIWGLIGAKAYYAGNRMAPNGVPFNPIFSLVGNFNVGILPNQKLYLFADTVFWGQKADAAGGITNPHQGWFDYSKREYDITMGFAWNYLGPWEFRIFAFGYNNLNRGVSRSLPSGYNDGGALENRYYLPTADKYDTAKRSFLSIGYYPTKTMVTGDGKEFSPGLFARAYLTWDLPWLNSYLYLDSQFLGEQTVKARLLNFDGGLATRPFLTMPSLEFRLGFSESYDVQALTNRWLGYGGFQIVF